MGELRWIWFTHRGSQMTRYGGDPSVAYVGVLGVLVLRLCHEFRPLAER